MSDATGSAIPRKNKSEMLFEGYLRANGYTNFEFEKPVPGTRRRPDYTLVHGDQKILIEVKEFRGTPDDFRFGFGSFDPYPPLREKIDACRKKFKDIGSHPCCLVLHNVDKPLILLDWEHVYGAMLGNLGFSVPIDMPGRPKASDAEIKNIFTTGGKMLREKGGVPIEAQNTTISAIIALRRVPVGNRLFSADIRRREAEGGRKFEREEVLSELDRTVGTEHDHCRRHLSVVVHENPFARIPLPSDLFRGPYDERYGAVGNHIQRLFQGTEIARLPKED